MKIAPKGIPWRLSDEGSHASLQSLPYPKTSELATQPFIGIDLLGEVASDPESTIQSIIIIHDDLPLISEWRIVVV